MEAFLYVLLSQLVSQVLLLLFVPLSIICRFMAFFPRTPGSESWAITQPVFDTFGCLALHPWFPDLAGVLCGGLCGGLCRASVENNPCYILLFLSWFGFRGWGGTDHFIRLWVIVGVVMAPGRQLRVGDGDGFRVSLSHLFGSLLNLPSLTNVSHGFRGQSQG